MKPAWQILVGDCREIATLAYCAGIVDGEGCIRIKRCNANGRRHTPGFHLSLHVAMADQEALYVLSETFGGGVRRVRDQQAMQRAIYRWEITDARVEHALTALLPYLRVKLANAENGLAFRAHQATSPEHRTKVIGTRDFPNQYGAVRVIDVKCLSDEFVARSECFATRGRELNSGKWKGAMS